MFYIGLDLAWASNRQTGIAVIDSSGNLLKLTAVRTNDEVEAVLRPFISDPCRVAIDAPLVVNNESGARPCELALNKDFRPFDAVAQSSSRRNPWFRPRPRGTILAEQLGFDIDPKSAAPRRAIEVYPHPAIVVIFGLPRIIKYKDRSPKGQKPRELSEMRTELQQLTHLIETKLGDHDVALRVDGHPDWARLDSDIRLAPTKAALNRAADEVDAVVCAYVARYADLKSEDVVMYGDIDHGYIVTPKLPPGLKAGEPALAVCRGVEIDSEAGLLDHAVATCRHELALLETAASDVAGVSAGGVSAAANEVGRATESLREARRRLKMKPGG